MRPRTLKIAFLIVFSLFLLLSFILPLVNQNGSITQLDGSAAVIDHPDKWGSLDPVSCIVYGAGDFICHQEMSRTYVLNGNEMPICVRDLGLLIGFIIGTVLMLLIREYKTMPFYAFAAVSIVLILLDWRIQSIHSLNVSVTRLITGLLAGAGIAFVLCILIDRRFDFFDTPA